jgi:serine/threonine-protein kinase
VLTGLAAAHCRQVVHRDLKPENVFIVESADGPRAKVIDFGVAGLLQADATAITGTDAILGSPAYLSPEQLRAEPTDHRTDLWSMGVIALECATGENPFVAVDILDLWQRVCEDPLPRPSAFGTVPPGFDEWFVKAVSRDRAARFESAEAMRQALARLPAQRSGTVVG